MPIYVINADELLDLEFIEGDALTNATVAQAYQRHARKGLDLRMLKIVSPRSIDPRYSISNADLLAAEQAELRGEPVFISMLGLGVGRTSQMVHVADWLSELHIRDPRLFGSLHKMSFAQMIAHSDNWHEAIARRARRLQDHGIPEDPFGEPIVMHLDGDLEGWTIRWLKTDQSRDTEGFVMGNCVGDGNYDNTGATGGIFSLRDPRNAPHVTIEVEATDFDHNEAWGRGNKPVAERYVDAVEKAMVCLCLRLDLNGSPLKPVADGIHTDHAGLTIHVRDGVLHRDGGPAKYHPTGIEEHWYRDGRLFRENGPTVVHSTGDLVFGEPAVLLDVPPHPVRMIVANGYRQEWFKGGFLHREGGPAVVSVFKPHAWWEPHDKINFEHWYLDGRRVNEEDGSSWIDTDTKRQLDILNWRDPGDAGFFPAEIAWVNQISNQEPLR